MTKNKKLSLLQILIKIIVFYNNGINQKKKKLNLKKNYIN